MLPKSTGAAVPVELREIRSPSRTFGLDIEGKRVGGYVDGLEAVKQAVYCILNTERYDYLIYSWNYGVEMRDLYGRPMGYVRSELKRRIKEALMQDDRITGVEGFCFSGSGRKLWVRFMVHTVFGDIGGEREVVV